MKPQCKQACGNPPGPCYSDEAVKKGKSGTPVILVKEQLCVFSYGSRVVGWRISSWVPEKHRRSSLTGQSRKSGSVSRAEGKCGERAVRRNDISCHRHMHCLDCSHDETSFAPLQASARSRKLKVAHYPLGWEERSDRLC